MNRRMMSAEDERAVELFRLRYTLRQAAERGARKQAAEHALTRLLEMARDAGSRLLLFEHQRWQVQLSF